MSCHGLTALEPSLKAMRKDSVLAVPTTSVETLEAADVEAWNWVASKWRVSGTLVRGTQAETALERKSKERAAWVNFMVAVVVAEQMKFNRLDNRKPKQ